MQLSNLSVPDLEQLFLNYTHFDGMRFFCWPVPIAYAQLALRVVKTDAVASVERCNAVQQKKIAQADEFATQIPIPATDLDVLNALRPARGTSTATQTAPIQTANISGQSA